MIRNSRLLPILLTCLVLFACGTIGKQGTARTSAEERSLRADIDTMLTDTRFQSAHLGIHVVALKTGHIVYSRNGAKRFLPASNMKLFTTAAGLHFLSPSFRFNTELLTDGPIEDNILKGNLIIRGGGDPLLSSYSKDQEPSGVFEDWAKALLHLGIKGIEGSLIVDTSYFEEHSLGEGWSHDDALFCYSAPREAFSFNGNCISLYVSPGAVPGSPAKIRVEPETPYPAIINHAITVDHVAQSNIRVERLPCAHSIRISGNVSLTDREKGYPLAVEDPVLFGASVFKERLSKQSIEVTGKIETRREYSPSTAKEHTRKVTSHRSPGLETMVKIINKESRNLPSEQLFLTIGKEVGAKGNATTATRAVHQFLGDAGIGTSGFSMADGSGLSRYNLVTPTQVVQLLVYMATHDYSAPFYDSLPVAGTDGTLRNKMTKSPLKGNLRAKTGSMTHVRNLSGYLKTRRGETLAFSMLCNNFSTSVEDVNTLYEGIALKLMDYEDQEQ